MPDVVAPAAQTPTAVLSAEPVAAPAAPAEPPKADPATPAPAVPQPITDYKDFTLLEGVESNKEQLAEFSTIAKEAKLTQDQAQKLVDFQSKIELDRSKSQEKAWLEMNDGWAADARADKEYGGVDFEKNIDVAMRPLDHFIPKEERATLTEELAATGMGNNPRLIRMLFRIGKAMGEDRMPNGGAGNLSGEKDVAKIMFPDQK